MKLSVIIPVHNAHDVTVEALKLISSNSRTKPELILIDNGSTPPFSFKVGDFNKGVVAFLEQGDVKAEHFASLSEGDEYFPGVSFRYLRNESNIGVWDTFKQGFDYATGDVLVYLHSDLMIHEKGWDQRLLDAFEQDSKLGLVGFVGSNEWGWNGGRGGGTMSNFQGIGRGSPAEAHGRRVTDLQAALQVDGCVMAMRREAMEQLGFFDWPPHHFYDRIYSLRMIKAGWHVGVLGVACDHISGQTANTQQGWQDTAREWCEKNGVPFAGGNWDQSVYLEAERRFLAELHEYMGGFRNLRCDANHHIT